MEKVNQQISEILRTLGGGGGPLWVGGEIMSFPTKSFLFLFSAMIFLQKIIQSCISTVINTSSICLYCTLLSFSCVSNLHIQQVKLKDTGLQPLNQGNYNELTYRMPGPMTPGGMNFGKVVVASKYLQLDGTREGCIPALSLFSPWPLHLQ